MVGIKLTRGATGRSARWETEDRDDPCGQVHVLTGVLLALEAQEENPGPFSAEQVHVAVAAVNGLVAELTDVELYEVRGPLLRAREGVENQIPNGFGPPPAPQRRNRFNALGQRALYLARSRDILEAEIGQDAPIAGYWVQEFEIPEEPFRILRLDPKHLSRWPRLNQLALLCEYKRTGDLQDPYVGTVFLRKLCDQIEIDGIEYPTVIGSFRDDVTALNLVLISERAIEAVAHLEFEAKPRFSKVSRW